MATAVTSVTASMLRRRHRIGRVAAAKTGIRSHECESIRTPDRRRDVLDHERHAQDRQYGRQRDVSLAHINTSPFVAGCRNGRSAGGAGSSSRRTIRAGPYSSRRTGRTMCA